MATTKKRINISVPQDIEQALEKLSKRDAVPAATKARELLLRGLEVEEDEVWDALAENRDRRGAQFVGHDKAWK